MTNRRKSLEVHLPRPHPKQREFIDHPAKRKIVRAGRRGGKTVGISIAAVEWFLKKQRVLYTAPTMEQVGRFWATVTRALYEPIKQGIFKKNESEHFIELPGTEQRLKAKTAWNADSLRGDYAAKLIFDEWQLVNEDAWGLVGAPMLLDTDGDAIFIYTPPSLRSRSVSKADDPQHAAKLFKKAQKLQAGGSKRWAAFHFSSMDNPYLSREALDEISGDMTALAYRMEILAEDVDEAPGALWTRKIIEDNRVLSGPDYNRIVVAVDPSISSMGDEAGLVVCGEHDSHGYVIADNSVQGSPLVWAKAAVTAYHGHKANLIVAEKNQGGEMVELTIHQVDPDVPVKLVHASKGKQARAEPISAKAEKGFVHHVGSFPQLEDELCLWIPGDPSPNRLDACFIAGTMIETENGPMPIEEIKKGDSVLTRGGYRKVKNCGSTGNKKVLRLMLSCGISLIGTGNHPIYTKKKGWMPLCQLTKSDILLTAPKIEQTIRVLSLSDLRGRDILPRLLGIKYQKTTNNFTLRYGRINMGTSPLDIMSTIKIKTLSIILLKILNALHPKNMLRHISLISLSKEGCTLKKSDHWRKYGILHPKELLFIPNTLKKFILNVKESKNNVLSVVKNILIWGTEVRTGFALEGASPGLMSAPIDIGKNDCVLYVERNLKLRQAKNNNLAPENVDIKSDSCLKPVYNLEIEEIPEYFANGVLVHNCVWGMTELLTQPKFGRNLQDVIG